jgi:hypothetical protein
MSDAAAPGMRTFRGSLSLGVAASVLAGGGALAHATPSTVFWSPGTAAVQGFGVMHGTYDTYFGTDGLYPIDLGLTIGVLPLQKLQAEVGVDLVYPTLSGDGGLSFPIYFNAKLGSPEDVFFEGPPGWSAGIYNLGVESDVTDYDMLQGAIGKTLPYIGTLSAGAYYGLNDTLLRNADGEKKQFGVMAGWASPAIDVPKIDKLVLCWDVQSGDNAFGATGGGAAIYFTPTVALLTGPVIFFASELQPGQSSWMWSAQLDVDVDLH